ncbi:response regulator [Roseibium sp. ROS1]
MPILILEDDPFISIDACEATSGLGHECLSAHDRATALRIIQTQGCECALLDFDLNGNNSIAVAKLLETSHTPYCFVTGRSIEEIVDASGLQAAVYTKPVDYGVIARTLISSK